jgi:hypothetical protein
MSRSSRTASSSPPNVATVNQYSVRICSSVRRTSEGYHHA